MARKGDSNDLRSSQENSCRRGLFGGTSSAVPSGVMARHGMAVRNGSNGPARAFVLPRPRNANAKAEMRRLEPDREKKGLDDEADCERRGKSVGEGVCIVAPSTGTLRF